MNGVVHGQGNNVYRKTNANFAIYQSYCVAVNVSATLCDRLRSGRSRPGSTGTQSLIEALFNKNSTLFLV